MSPGKFPYEVQEHEAEKASNSYVISLAAMVVGLPLPIFNLIATFFFFIANRKESYFVRWHCTQALLSQFSLLFVNSFGFWWTVAILFDSQPITNHYISYLITAFLLNLAEFTTSIYTAVNTRKGIHVSWWFYGEITNLICKK
ncbi:hypothetical protein BZG02_08150 [Labilibaculum filiforme]|uniref:DUF4870 domain-containing protein n=1 Tax=Labilibaculum filiforme TaxID=1940526 RepID=A0A2N3I0Z6_9BACT|nr:DUF4870 domain-containing protein [Labilibaculum filiforme]PKQ63974.1 hypothetical protein BZG02_08150 [Labilibaculum filiforme]